MTSMPRLALAALLAIAPAAAHDYTTFGPEGLRTGVIVGQAQCPDRAGQVWVATPHADGAMEGACIRYFAAGLQATNPQAVVFVHGNRLARIYDDEGRLIRSGANPGYGRATEASLQAAAATQARVAKGEAAYRIEGVFN